MSDLIVQSNYFTSSRYDLSLMEKRIFFFIVSQIRKRYSNKPLLKVDGHYVELILDINLSELNDAVSSSDKFQQTIKACSSLLSRRFYYEDKTQYFECNFINSFQYFTSSSIVTIKVSGDLLPHLLDLAKNFTTYSLNVAMSLKSKYSQRFYELCNKWNGTDGFRIAVTDLRNMFDLSDNKYPRFALFTDRILVPAQQELKTLFDLNQCDVYFTYSVERTGRTVTHLRFKLFRREDVVVNNNKRLLDLHQYLNNLFEVSKKPKNELFIKKVVSALQRNPDLISKIHTRLRKMSEVDPELITERYIRFILNEDVIEYDSKLQASNLEKLAKGTLTKKASKASKDSKQRTNSQESNDSGSNESFTILANLANSKKA